MKTKSKKGETTQRRDRANPLFKPPQCGKRTTMEDVEIIDLYWSRNEDAIRETDIKYGRLCKSVACSILASNEDADECVNDSYLGMWNAIPDARPTVFSAFLCRIVRNLSLKKFEYVHAEKRNPCAVVSLEELYGCISDDGDSDDPFGEADTDDDTLREAINRFLELLSEDARCIFIRRYWFFESVREIALHYGMSESKVESALVRARKKFKLFLIKEGF